MDVDRQVEMIGLPIQPRMSFWHATLGKTSSPVVFGSLANQRQWAYPIMSSRKLSVDRKVELTLHGSRVTPNYHNELRWDRDGTGARARARVDLPPPPPQWAHVRQRWNQSQSWPPQWAQVGQMGLEPESEWPPTKHPTILHSDHSVSCSCIGNMPLCFISIVLKIKIIVRLKSGAAARSGVDPSPAQWAQVRQRWDQSQSDPPTTTTMSSDETEMELELEPELTPTKTSYHITLSSFCEL